MMVVAMGAYPVLCWYVRFIRFGDYKTHAGRGGAQITSRPAGEGTTKMGSDG